jgi:drug/metabolite transporter (DMT)-like permease
MSSSHALKMRLAPWALLLVSASWGLAFVVMKDAIERQSVNSFLFLSLSHRRNRDVFT